MRLLGAALLTGAFVLAGLLGAGGLKRRARELEELMLTMELLGFELGRFRAPLPALCRQLSQHAPGCGAACFRRLLLLTESRPELCFWQQWALAMEPLAEPARGCLLPLGQILGRYEAAEEQAAVEACRRRLELLWQKARDDHSRNARVYVGLAACAGAVLSVMLL